MNVGDSWVFKEFYSQSKTDTFRRRVTSVASNGDFTMEVTTDKLVYAVSIVGRSSAKNPVLSGGALAQHSDNANRITTIFS